MKTIIKTLSGLILTVVFMVFVSCSPAVRVEAPEKPITINLNVKIEHEIKVKVEKDLDSLLSADSGLF